MIYQSIYETFMFFAHHLIELMGTGMFVALAVRFVAYRTSQSDELYFKTFARGVEKALESEDKSKKVEDVDAWLGNLLEHVTTLLPERVVRFRKAASPGPIPPESAKFTFRHKESLNEYAGGKRSIVHSVRLQTDSFRSPHPPNFTELAQRVLGMDPKWKRVMGLPFDMLARVLDILPGLFVVGGILGTFIAIAAALPMVGKIDLSNIQESGPVLTAFIDNVSHSMQCSVTGIFCSVIMTLLNALYPILSSRQAVQRQLERTFEMMWHRIHGNKLSYVDQRTLSLLERMEAHLADLTTGHRAGVLPLDGRSSRDEVA